MAGGEEELAGLNLTQEASLKELEGGVKNGEKCLKTAGNHIKKCIAGH